MGNYGAMKSRGYNPKVITDGGVVRQMGTWGNASGVDL